MHSPSSQEISPQRWRLPLSPRCRHSQALSLQKHLSSMVCLGWSMGIPASDRDCWFVQAWWLSTCWACNLAKAWKRGKCVAGSNTASIWQLHVKTKQGKTRWQASVAFAADEPWGLIHVVEGRYGQSHNEEENHALSLLNFLTLELECRLAAGYLKVL